MIIRYSSAPLPAQPTLHLHMRERVMSELTKEQIADIWRRRRAREHAELIRLK
jgi:hypothetical protein